MSIKYHFGIFWGALKDTAGFFFDVHDRKDLARSLFLPIVLFLLQWQASGFSPSASGITIPVVYAAISSVLIVLVSMLWFASPKLSEQQAKKIADLEDDKAALKRALEPRMQLVFRSGGSFEQLFPLEDRDTGKWEGKRRLRRIGVHNLGSKTIRGVSVILAEAEPSLNQATPIPLHRLHGIGGPVYDLDPGVTLYFEILTTFEDTPNKAYRDSFAIEHSVDMPNYFNPLKNHRFRVEATATDTPLAYRYFLLRVDENNLARFGPE